jgi:hypothetical protein
VRCGDGAITGYGVRGHEQCRIFRKNQANCCVERQLAFKSNNQPTPSAGGCISMTYIELAFQAIELSILVSPSISSCPVTSDVNKRIIRLLVWYGQWNIAKTAFP